MPLWAIILTIGIPGAALLGSFVYKIWGEGASKGSVTALVTAQHEDNLLVRKELQELRLENSGTIVRLEKNIGERLDRMNRSFERMQENLDSHNQEIGFLKGQIAGRLEAVSEQRRNRDAINGG
jgi:vacuolar-type H+-ATPase subunit I/STV1